MYNDFYKFTGEPFRVTPDPQFLFLTDQYKEALAAIVYGIAQRKGFICITGEVGVGKTTILRSYLAEIDRDKLRFVYIFNPNLTFRSLLVTTLRDLGIEHFPDGVPGMVERLHEYLIDEYQAGRTVVLFIDEAHNMPVDTLENMRMLSNLETATDKLIQIVLVGQRELEDLLARPELRQLRSRIAIQTRIGPLSPKESVAYIRHRLERVAGDDLPVFTSGAVALIVRKARGIPRLINILADNALINGFGYRRRPVDARIVREVIADTAGPKSRWTMPPWGPVAAGAAGVLVLGLAAGALIVGDPPPPRPVAAASEALPPPPPPPEPVADRPAEAPPTPLLAALVPEADLPAALPPVQMPPTAPAPPPEVAVGITPQTSFAPATPVETAPDADPSPLRDAITALVAAAESADRGRKAPSITRTVRPGDTLFGLMHEVYGAIDRRHVEWVQANNPQLENVNRLYVGQVLTFPRVPPPPKPRPPR